jgi:hypothetical protein
VRKRKKGLVGFKSEINSSIRADFKKLKKNEENNQNSVRHFLQTYGRLNTFSLPQPKDSLSPTKHLPK